MITSFDNLFPRPMAFNKHTIHNSDNHRKQKRHIVSWQCRGFLGDKQPNVHIKQFQKAIRPHSAVRPSSTYQQRACFQWITATRAAHPIKQSYSDKAFLSGAVSTSVPAQENTEKERGWRGGGVISRWDNGANSESPGTPLSEPIALTERLHIYLPHWQITAGWVMAQTQDYGRSDYLDRASGVQRRTAQLYGGLALQNKPKLLMGFWTEACGNMILKTRPLR